MVGVDYDCCGRPSPENWTQNDFLNNGASNLTFDNGVPSSIDLVATPLGGGSLGVTTGDPLASTIPMHKPQLDAINGSSRFSAGLALTFTELVPGVEYSVFVFGLDVDSAGSYSQTVTISGATTLPSFTQVLPEDRLWVNGQEGSSSSNLISFGESVAANASGQITISITPDTGSDGISLGGIALAKTPIIPTTVAPTITSNGGGATAIVTIDENTTDVTDVDTTDDINSEGSGLTYSLTTNASGGADNGLFTLDSTTGLLAFINAPDYENPQDIGGTAGDNQYSVQVTVTDSDGETGHARHHRFRVGHRD